MELTELFVKISGDISGLERSMTAAQRAVKKTGDALGDMGKKLTIGVTVPLAALGGLAVRSASQLDSLTRGLSAVLGPAGNVGQELERLADIAKLPGLGFREAIQGFTRLKAAGLSIGLAEDALRGFGNALATVGAGKAELDQVTRALSQIASKGKISAEEINQIAEVVPQIRVVMQEAFGTSNSELLQKAGIDAETFIRKVTDELLKLEQVTGGPQNAFENLSDATFRASAALGDKLLPVVLPLVEGLAKMAEGIRSISPDTVKWGIALAAVAAVAGPLLIVLGGLATTMSVLAAAIGVGLLPLIAVGGPLLIGLAALSGWFIKTKLDALDAAGALEEFERQQKSLAATLGTSSAPDIASATKAQLVSMREALLLRVQGMGGKMEGQELVFGAFDSEEFQRIQGLFDQIDSRLEEMGQAGIDAGGGIADGLAEAAEAARELTEEFQAAKDVFDAAMAAYRTAMLDTSGLTAGIATPGRPGTLDLAHRGLGPGPQERAQGMLDAQKQGPIGQALSSLIGPLGAVTAAFAVLKPIFDGLMEALGPVLSTLAEPLKMVGRLLGMTIAPVLGLLAPILEAVADAFSYVIQGLGTFVKGLGWAIDKITFGLGGFGKDLMGWGQDMVDNAKAAREGTLATEDATEAMQSFASSMSNVPVVFNAALARFRLGSGVGSGPGMPTTGIGPTDTGGGMVPGRPAFSVTIAQANFNGVEDFDSFKRQMEAYGAEIQVRGGYSNWSPAFG